MLTSATALGAIGSACSSATGPILLTTRGVAEDSAVRLAWRLAGHMNADVQVLTVLEPVAPLDVRFTTMPPARGELLAAQRDEQLAQVRTQLCRAAGTSCGWPVAVMDGAADEAIARLAAEQDARVILIGRGQHGLVAQALGGDTGFRILCQTDVPVYCVAPQASELARHVLVAVDFSSYSLLAARAALALVAPGAVVTLAHVRPRVPVPTAALSDWERGYDRAVRLEFDRLVEDLAAPDGVQVESVVLSGDAPAHALADFALAWHADLLVCSTHGDGFLTRLILGSVAAELLRMSPCSLLCVPAAVPAHAAAPDAEGSRLMRDDVPSTAWEAEVHRFADHFRGRKCTATTMEEHGVVDRDAATGALADVQYSADGRAVRVVLGMPDAATALHSIEAADVRGVERLTDASGDARGLRVLAALGGIELRIP